MLKEIILNAVAKASKRLADLTGRFADSAQEEPAPAPVPIIVDSDHPQLVIKQEKLKGFSDMYSVVRSYKPDADMHTVVIPNGIVALDRGCFAKCKTLEEVYIPDSVSFMDGNVFFECSALRRVRLPAGLTEIPFWGFRDCDSLKELELPRRIHRIGFCAFWASGIERITLPEGVETIQLSAFALCRSLGYIGLPSTLKEIEDSVFESTDSLTEIRLPNSLRSLGERAFWHSGLVSVEIPPRLKELKYRTFRECKQLKSIYIPDNISAVGSEAFMDCSALTAVRVPAGVDTDNTVFEGCEALEWFTAGNYSVDVSRAAHNVNVGILTAFIVRVVRLGRFETDDETRKAVGDLFLRDIAFQLAEQGFPNADEYILADMSAALSAMAALDRPAAFDKLVRMGARIPPEDIEGYIRQSIDSERREMYLALLRYKRDILGFSDGEDTESRFEL